MTRLLCRCLFRSHCSSCERSHCVLYIHMPHMYAWFILFVFFLSCSCVIWRARESSTQIFIFIQLSSLFFHFISFHRLVNLIAFNLLTKRRAFAPYSQATITFGNPISMMLNIEHSTLEFRWINDRKQQSKSITLLFAPTFALHSLFLLLLFLFHSLLFSVFVFVPLYIPKLDCVRFNVRMCLFVNMQIK